MKYYYITSHYGINISGLIINPSTGKFEVVEKEYVIRNINLKRGFNEKKKRNKN